MGRWIYIPDNEDEVPDEVKKENGEEPGEPQETPKVPAQQAEPTQSDTGNDPKEPQKVASPERAGTGKGVVSIVGQPLTTKASAINEQAILNMTNKQVIENMEAIKNYIAGR